MPSSPRPCWAQHALPRSAASAVAGLPVLDEDAVRLLLTVPARGSVHGGIPSDPTISRFLDMLPVYGTTLKASVHQPFGDGIIGASNFRSC